MTFYLVRKRWPFSPEDDPWEKFVAGEITHFEALSRIFVTIRTSEASLLELVESMELDADLAESVRVLQDCGWEVVIASAGCEWYILHDAKTNRHSEPGPRETGSPGSNGHLRRALRLQACSRAVQ